MYKFVVFILCFGCSWCSVIIPEELPSLLSVAYSNIPPIKKGTDSRVGFGFAFGNHADFQVLFELGPQTNTNAIGQAFPSNTKRQAPSLQKINKNKEKYLQSEGGNYLANWAQKMKYPSPLVRPEGDAKPKPGELPNLEESLVELVKNDKGQYEIHQPSPSHIERKALNQLKKLYAEDAKANVKNDAVKLTKTEKPEATESKRSEEEIKKITEDLSNVDLD